MRKFLMILFGIVAHVFITTNTSAQELPKFLRPSPEASALFRFQDYPMDYSTGLPQISIPIYEVKSGSLSVPISISYHASGRRVTDRDGPVALGWSLNAGGMISRTIYGSPDFGTFTNGTDKFPYPFKLDNITNQNDLEYLEKIMHYQNYLTGPPFYDTEYDVFSYSFGGNSGKFVFKDNNNQKTPVFLPYKPFQLTPTYNENELLKIEVIDDKGVYYLFIPGEKYGTNGSAVSSWLLKKIVSADKADVIEFEYTSAWEERVSVSQSTKVWDMWYLLSATHPQKQQEQYEQTNRDYYLVSRLTQINFKQGKIVFNVSSGPSKSVDSIHVINKNNEVLKTIQFNRSPCYTQSMGILVNKLDAVVFKDNLNNDIETYAFEYFPVATSISGQLNIRYADWWGYYNNSGQDNMRPYYSNVPYDQNSNQFPISVGNPYANRNPDLDGLKSGVLKKIIYPTGGTTEFTYEQNRCTLNGIEGSWQYGPGLRVSQIKTMEESGATMYRTFKYGINERSYGAIDLMPDMDNMSSTVWYGYTNNGMSWDPFDAGKYRERTFYSSFVSSLSELADRPVVYTEVTEYQGTETENIGKTIYRYDYSQWAPSSMPGGQHKQIYHFNYWNNPSLLSSTIYKRVDKGGGEIVYHKVKETINTYNPVTTETIRGLHVARNIIAPQTGIWGPNNYHIEQFLINENLGNPFGGAPAQIYAVTDYQIPAGYKNLQNTTETFYNDDGSEITTGASFVYNAKQYVSETSKTTSDQNTITSIVKYPFDYTGNSVLSQMVGLNMLNFPIEQIEVKNGTIPLKALKTTYKNWRTAEPLLAPELVETKQGNNNYEIKLRYHEYDGNGNVLTVSKEKDVKKTYIWGYNKAYPVAEITGVDHATILNTVTTLNQSVLDNPTSDQAVVNEIQKIRNAFPAAHITTVTYKPLVGVTSQIDLNGRATYYEYDAYGRLKLIRDLDGNIVKTFKYQIKSNTPQP